MNENKYKRERLRNQSAERLFYALQRRADDSVAQLEAVAEQMKARHPELAERVERVISQAIARTRQMPEAVTALYLVDTQEPPEIIEGEVVERQSLEAEVPEVNHE